MNAVVGAVSALLHPLRRASAERAPFKVELGPYRFGVELRAPADMSDRRRRSCINIEEQRIELRHDLRGLRLAEAFFHVLIRLSHFSKGCQQGCVEEAYTHSLATGLVEFAQRNSRAWVWFNLLLNEHLPARACYDLAVSGAVPTPPPMPSEVLVAGRAVPMRTLTRTQTGNAFGWYDFERREVQLYEGLTGANVAIVALHEITHALHHAHGLRVRDDERRFIRAQLAGWLEIMTRDPDTWRWLVWAMSFPGKATLA
jgi:hypothetical protein